MRERTASRGGVGSRAQEAMGGRRTFRWGCVFAVGEAANNRLARLIGGVVMPAACTLAAVVVALALIGGASG